MIRLLKIASFMLGALILLAMAGQHYIKSQMGAEALEFIKNMSKQRLGMEVEVRQDEFANNAISDFVPDSIQIDAELFI